MVSMHVSLSKMMKNWVEGQIASGQHHKVSEYIRDLIRRDRDGLERLKVLRAHLADGEADIAAGHFKELRSLEEVKETFARVKRSTQ